MKIRKLQLKNIGVFDDETIEFQPCPTKDKAEIHIFTGENGSGKSTILQALASSFDDTGIELPIEEIESKMQNYGYIVMDADFHLSNNFRKRYRRSGEYEVTFDNRDRTKLQSKGNLIDYITSPERYLYSGFVSGRKKLISEKIFFAVFAYSGYRHIESKHIEAIYEPKDFNPLSQSLEFIKNYDKTNQITINQLIANNISKRAIEKERNKDKADKFETVLLSINKFITEVTGWDVKFELQTEPIDLVLKLNDKELDFDVLPDGLRSLISWIADLLGRVDLLKWEDDLPIFEKNLILLLDEIEVHLHPAWQRKVLPVVQKLFKNSQIFVSTHSPFVVNSVDDAWVYKLKLDENGKARCEEPLISEDGYSYETVLREIFGINERFGKETQEKLNDFLKNSKTIFKQNGNNQINKETFLDDARNLASQSAELQSIVFLELAKLSNKTGEKYEI